MSEFDLPRRLVAELLGTALLVTTVVGSGIMGTGAAALILVGTALGSFGVLSQFTAPQWIAGIYLGVGGGAAAFILWVLALERASPTRVANTMPTPYIASVVPTPVALRPRWRTA